MSNRSNKVLVMISSVISSGKLGFELPVGATWKHAIKLAAPDSFSDPGFAGNREKISLLAG